jgi:glycerol-3-phosphate dehydrogenase (NAD(P)+)
MKFIAVIGEGAWGMAMSSVIAHNGYNVRLWCHDAKVASQLNAEHKNERYMPHQVFSPRIFASTSIEDVVKDAEWVFISTPVKFLRSVVTQCQAFYTKEQRWVVLSKGIECDSLQLPFQVLVDVLGNSLQYAVLGGPSFARDVVNKDLVGVVIGGSNNRVAHEVKFIVGNEYFVPCVMDDLSGIQLGGALKNVAAIIMGCVAGYAESTRAFIFVRVWQEMCMLARVLGARQETLCGLAGIGDLFLTVSGSASRNLKTGKLLAQGKKIDEIERDLEGVSEGLNTVRAVYKIIQMHDLRLPFLQGLYMVVFEHADPSLFIHIVAHEERCTDK